jgi:hypothetical protein
LTSNTELKPGPLGGVFTSNPKAVAVYVPAGAHFSVTDAPFLIDFAADAPFRLLLLAFPNGFWS